jgi:catechol 2,3-dioxygenase-like lactoylglutathione lyase family enzyme
MDMKLELIMLHVSDVDRTRDFYAGGVGFAVDHDQLVSRADPPRVRGLPAARPLPADETRYEGSKPMSRHIQVTFDAHDPRALSSFWRDALGYVHPGPPGVDLPEDADPLAAWDDFRIGDRWLDEIGTAARRNLQLLASLLLFVLLLRTDQAARAVSPTTPGTRSPCCRPSLRAKLG